MNLLMFTLAADARHVTLAFGLRWIEALAARFDHIDVVTMTEGPHALPSNVTVWSLGRERGYSEPRRALRFYRLLAGILRRRRIDIVFTHMIPLFAVMGWPLLASARLRNVMWYAHGATPAMMRLGHRLVSRAVSSTPEGFRIPSAKISFIGQGIDGSLFRFAPRTASRVLRLISVGRLAPSKGLDLLMATLREWRGSEWRLTIVGEGTSAEERAYADELRAEAARTFASGQVTFTGRLDPPDIAPHLRDADLFVNLSATGSLDKAMVEAMASGCPVISSNDAFKAIARREGFAPCAVARAPEAVRAALDWFVTLDRAQRADLAACQSTFAGEHTLDRLIERLHAILLDEARAGRSAA